jgi:uncharacterized protein (DUF427 family)
MPDGEARAVESVWDYPRPPRLERVLRRVRVELGGGLIVDSARAWRVCETAGPPCYYVPPEDVAPGVLSPSPHRSVCEWKGEACYWNASAGGRVVEDAAWSYPAPAPGFEPIRDHVAFYAGRVDACWVGDDRVVPQPGRFYGGWITPELRGPFKGDPGSEHW